LPIVFAVNGNVPLKPCRRQRNRPLDRRGKAAGAVGGELQPVVAACAFEVVDDDSDLRRIARRQKGGSDTIVTTGSRTVTAPLAEPSFFPENATAISRSCPWKSGTSKRTVARAAIEAARCPNRAPRRGCFCREAGNRAAGEFVTAAAQYTDAARVRIGSAARTGRATRRRAGACRIIFLPALGCRLGQLQHASSTAARVR